MSRIKEKSPKPHLELSEEQREKLSRIADEDLDSSEIAEAILRHDDLS